MTYRNNTHTERWKDIASYHEGWSTRSRTLIEMFMHSEADAEKSYELSEFGCGPYAPFSTILKDNDKFTVKKHDIEAWDPDTRVVDLNDADIEFSQSDIAAFSGVLEYLNDIQAVLTRAIACHRYLLVSYAFVPADAKTNDMNYLKIIKTRSATHGWRNHYSNEDFVRIISSVGVIVEVGLWEDQSLFVMRAGSHTSPSGPRLPDS